MPNYGKVKVNTLTYDSSGSAVDLAVSNIALKENPTFTGTITAAALTLSGDLTVGGTTTTINSTTLTVDDKNIELGSVDTPSDTTADGGGITLKGATDKTITWTDSTDTWDFNQNIKITGGGSLKLETDAEGVKTYGRFYSAGTYAYIESTSTTNSTITLRKSSSGADSIDYIQCRDNSNALKYKVGGTGNVEANTVNANTFTSAGSVLDSKGDVREIPQASKSSAYTVATADAGKHIYISTGGVTFPSGGLTVGQAITLINNSSSDQTIACVAVTMYLAGDTTAKTSLTLKGRAMATFLCAATGSGAANVYYGSGAGLE